MHRRSPVAAIEVSAISSGAIGPPLATRRRSRGPERPVVRSERRARCAAPVRQSGRGAGGQAVSPDFASVVEVDEVVLEIEVDDDARALLEVVVDEDVLVELLAVEDDDVVLEVVVVDVPGRVLVVTVDDVELEVVVVEEMDDDEDVLAVDDVLDDDEVVVLVAGGLVELLLDVLVDVGTDEDVEVEDDVLVVVVGPGGALQSRSQVAAVSSPLHAASPQHATTLWSVHEAPQRALSHPTGFVPALPQQKRLAGLPA